MRVHLLIWGLVVAVFGGAAMPAHADPLNVTDFDSLGEFPWGASVYTINTSGDPTLTGPDGTAITGVVFDGIAVFTFDSITIGKGMTITAYGDRPLALLSYSDVVMCDTGAVQINGNIAQGGPGGGSGGGSSTSGQGPGGGGIGGGGGFGGHGGGNGGPNYGDLAVALEGGSGGGGGANHGSPSSGGGGGGGIEIGALGGILIGGNGIQAMGGIGADSIHFRSYYSSGGGGGSGGGIFLHGESVELEGLLNAMGGRGGRRSDVAPGGGGGGGGQVLILTGQGGFLNNGEIDVSGGIGDGGNGEDGTITIGDLGPEPVTLGMGVLGALALLDFAHRRRKRALAAASSGDFERTRVG